MPCGMQNYIHTSSSSLIVFNLIQLYVLLFYLFVSEKGVLRNRIIFIFIK